MLMVFALIAFISVIILGISALFGGDHGFGDHEVSFEGGYEHEVDHDHDGSGGPSPFSLKIMAVFGTAFGSVGAICTHLGIAVGWSTLVGLVSGFILGGLAFQMYKFMFRQQSNSTVSVSDAVGGIADVSTAIPSGGIGEVSFVSKGQRLYVSAKSEDGKAIPSGSTVEVVANPSGTLVVRLKQ